MSEDEDIAASVEKHGWHAIAVAESPHSPSFLYTIGLCAKRSHPEMIVFGLEQRQAYDLTSSLVARIGAGSSFASPGVHDRGPGEPRVGTRPVHPSQHPVYLGYAMGYYRHIAAPETLVAVQLFWPDARGVFPFEVHCNSEVAYLQPRLELPHVGKSGAQEW
jgi:hypothetical protein